MLFLALRQLLSRKKQSSFILIGVVLGTTAYIVISGVMLGFQQYLLDKLVNNTAQISISAKEQVIQPSAVKKALFGSHVLVHWQTKPSGVRELDYIINPQGWYQKLSHSKQVIAYVPQLTANALIANHGSTRSVSITGTTAKQQLNVTNLGKDITEGSFTSLTPGSNRVAIGSGLAQKLGVALNNTINLTNSTGLVRAFKVSGIFNAGDRRTDDNSAYMDINDLQSFEDKQGKVDTIAVKVVDPYNATALANDWQAFSQEKVESWQQRSENILSVFYVQTFIRYFMVCSILLVSGFGIYNVLNIMINQKRREIAILRAIGYTSHDIVRLFFTQGFLFGLIGGLLGITIGYIICLYIATLPAVGMSRGSGTMSVTFSWTIYAWGLCLALGSSIFASIIPARAAGKLQPIAIIRSEASA